jgi:hypothetical protein
VVILLIGQPGTRTALLPIMTNDSKYAFGFYSCTALLHRLPGLLFIFAFVFRVCFAHKVAVGDASMPRCCIRFTFSLGIPWWHNTAYNESVEVEARIWSLEWRGMCIGHRATSVRISLIATFVADHALLLSRWRWPGRTCDGRVGGVIGGGGSCRSSSGVSAV